MKLATVLLIATIMQVSAASFGQRVTLHQKQITLDETFREIRKQTGYDVLLITTKINTENKVDANFNNTPLADVMNTVLAGKPLSFKIEDKTIVIKEKTVIQEIADFLSFPSDIRGRVTDEKGQPLIGATVKVKGTNITVITDNEGSFFLRALNKGAIISISYIGFQAQEIVLSSNENLHIVLSLSLSKLDEVVIIPYGTTTQRLNTSSISKVTAAEIEKQPVNNLLEALYGKVPGLVITSTGGLTGSAIKVQLRGRTSINSSISNDPLFIIDGVPYAPNNNNIGNTGNAAGSVSPFNSISPSDIERIDVLKDADATAIYGSRGSNGVILIQTKRGKSGKTQINADVYTGWSTQARSADWLNTQQYVAMRKEAFKNDNIAMTNTNAYDILLWDTTRYTDFKKLLMNNTAHQTNAQMSISGGTENTQYLISGTYNRQTTVYAGDFSNDKGSVLFNLNHTSEDKRLNVLLSGNYVSSQNNSTAADLSNQLNLMPNLPSLYDDSGNLKWSEAGFTYTNPLAFLKQQYENQTKNLISNLQVSYLVIPKVRLKSNFGYNVLNINELSATPIASQNPAVNPTGSAKFSKGEFRSLIIEPQMEYNDTYGHLKLNALLGGTYQNSNTTYTTINAAGYTNDLLIETPAAAASNTINSATTEYKYAAVFGRISLDWQNKYLLNFTGRRDGSSRFGVNNQFANFGSIGAGYVFTEEHFFKSSPAFLSFGKFRASFGITGNDKIGDYAYLSTYSPTSQTFQGIATIYPTKLSNPDYAWEVNKKLEVGLELGFLKDRILLTGDYYNNKSSNQLINYALPNQTGGSSILLNFPAKVENSGIELELSATNISSKQFKWNTSINISFPKNRLLDFPNLSSSSYTSLIIGQPLSIYSGFEFTGINQSNGLPEFKTAAGSVSSTPVSSIDRNTNLGNLDPKYYGGVNNELTFRNWSLSFLFEFRKQTGTTIIGNMYSTRAYPGMMYNQTVIALDRWHDPGDVTQIPKFTTSSSSAVYLALGNVTNFGNSYKIGDASYVRMKNVYLSYMLPKSWLGHWGFKSIQLYSAAQNLFVLTPYKYADPETQTLFRTQPLRTITVGLKSKF